MLDNNKKVLETIVKAVPEMDEFNKGYLLGMGEALIREKFEAEKRETISKTLDESK